MHSENAPAMTLAEMRGCGWELIVKNNLCKGYTGLFQDFSNAATSAVGEKDLRKGECLRLLAHATSMMLAPMSINEPFRPMLSLTDGRRSALPSDFSIEDLSLLASFVDFVDNPWLRARLSDLAWLTLRPPNPKFALMAINAYVTIPLRLETWIAGGDDCWRRAVSLARMLRRTAEKDLQAIESAALARFLQLDASDGFMAFWLAEFMRQNRFGTAAAYAISESPGAIAFVLGEKNEFHASRTYFEEAEHWFSAMGDKNSSAQMLANLAKAWEAEADAALSSYVPSNMVAADFYEKAIQSYRRIPGALRGQHAVEKRIAEVHEKLTRAGAGALGEMHVLRSDPIDVTEIIDRATDLVKGKAPLDALNAFVNVTRGIGAEQLRKRSEQSLKEFPLLSLFAAVYYSRDGRVIAKRPGAGPRDHGSDDHDAAVHAEMMREYRMQLGLVTQALILPALDMIRLEHRLRRADFAALAYKSPIVPADRAEMFGRGLYAGFDNDFAAALHLLVPQVEHVVRYQLKAAGAKTTNVARNGVENENGLSTLLELPELEQVFGNDLAFEMRALFCDPLGWNIRNELAHGLLNEDDCFSAGSIYAWWFCLKLVFLPFWNATQNGETADDEGPIST
ncbi:DUF4209 domain-containing protein [Caballeronia sp. LZ008]|uniref:DUF4209 domain-containing protein n=1 Tax=unclassified Caballeronia TaxID=2646786 RepID=UPI0020286CAB|nr:MULTISPECIES: DUF4209 domain-containing protein [unclassified Caballeronia]MDR5792100.1 DUF4209 domain-containing protein [Caballeronia sp. LZ008]